jgi:hypothetical protein
MPRMARGLSLSDRNIVVQSAFVYRLRRKPEFAKTRGPPFRRRRFPCSFG